MAGQTMVTIPQKQIFSHSIREAGQSDSDVREKKESSALEGSLMSICATFRKPFQNAGF